jgi:hypothetical protein
MDRARVGHSNDMTGQQPEPDAVGSRTARGPSRPVAVTVCPNGPLLVRGEVEIEDASGRRVVPRHRTIALCRCGFTGRPPFCDGTHTVVGAAPH